MGKDIYYINGIVAAVEKSLLGDKLLRMCELTPQDAFRTLTESGYGAGVVNEDGLYGFENLVAAEERALDAFILAYAPTRAELIYLLAPRDFHNAKAVLKANYLGCDVSPMLGPDGLIPSAELQKRIAEGTLGEVNADLAAVVRDVQAYLSEATATPSGAWVGAAFERALHAHLSSHVKHGFLRDMLGCKADMLNILTYFRASDEAQAQDYFVTGGKLKPSALSVILTGEEGAIRSAFAKTPYLSFVDKCLACRENKTPFSECERLLATVERRYLNERKYQLSGKQPFLYYVFRKRAENADVRVVFVCLTAGMDEANVKKRLRAS